MMRLGGEMMKAIEYDGLIYVLETDCRRAVNAVLATNQAKQERITALIDALMTIRKGVGAFDRDPLIHANNTIDKVKEIARAAIAKASKPDSATTGDHEDLERAELLAALNALSPAFDLMSGKGWGDEVDQARVAIAKAQTKRT